MPESKSKFLIPAIGAFVVVFGSIAAYMYFKGGPSGDISGALGSAKLVPDEALMATYISTDPKVWAKLEQFGTPEAQKLVAKGLEDINNNLSTDSNISYEKDLKPWVGGVMIAVLPPNPVKPAQNAEPRTQEPQILMVVGIKDKISALNFANKLKSQKNVKFQENDYKGEKIIETSGKSAPTYSAVLNNAYVVFAPEKQAVENAIDTYKGEPSFATKEGANSILTKGVNVENTVAQIYVPDYVSMVQQLIAANPQRTQLPPQTLAQLKQVKSMVASVGIDNVGVRMKAIANLDPQLVKFQYQNTRAQVVSQLPGDTIALISGQGISSWWSAVVEQSKDYPELNQTLEQARTQLKSSVDIDLDQEIFGWMNGEFGFAAIPSNQGVLAQIGFGGALVFHTSDRTKAEATFTKLDTFAKKQLINIATKNIGGKDVTEWQIPQQGALLTHGWLDRDTVFVTVGSIAEALAAPKGQSLDNSDNFKATTGSLQKPNSGYFYIDMDKTVSLLNRFATAQQQPISPEASAIMSSIRGLGVTATSSNKSTSEVEMLLALKPKTN